MWMQEGEWRAKLEGVLAERDGRHAQELEEARRAAQAEVRGGHD
jgi:hypothetical protein